MDFYSDELMSQHLDFAIEDFTYKTYGLFIKYNAFRGVIVGGKLITLKKPGVKCLVSFAVFLSK